MLPELERFWRTDDGLTASERAEAYGIDWSLLDDNLLLTPSERLAQNDAALEFANGLRDAIHGPVTLLSVVESGNGSLFFLVAEDESVPGPILEIGNTNSRYRFPIGARRFVNDWNSHGPAHHCAVGVDHIAHKLRKLAALLSIQMESVC